MVREATIEATASTLNEDNTLRDSLGPTASNHAKAQARKLRGQNARDRQHRQMRERQRERQRQTQDPGATEPPHDGVDRRRAGGDGVAFGEGLDGGIGRMGMQGNRQAGRWTEEGGSAMERAATGGDFDWGETAYVYDRAENGAEEGVAVAEEGADLVRSRDCRPRKE